MRGFLFLAIALDLGIGGPVRTPDDRIFEELQLDSVVVSAGRAYNSTPVAHMTLTAHELAKASPSSSLPMALGRQTSVIATNEGGTGIGNSAIRVRGIPGNQTIVTLNGITLNDAETQEVFWVNIPAIGRYIGSLQLQRGLGTTACGAGAFGAGINMVTDTPVLAGGGAEIAGGSFGTFTSFARASTGATPIGLFAEAAASWQRTDGFIRNGFANVRSAYAAFGWQGPSDVIRLTFLHGSQRSGICWEGEPLERFLAGDYTYNPSGMYITPEGTAGYHDNQVDDYRQTHLQLLASHSFNRKTSFQTTLNLTKGDGFYEQLIQPADGPTRDAEGNTLWALRTELRRSSEFFKGSAGIYLSSFSSRHWGDNAGIGHLYDNGARKREIDVWMRAEWMPLPFINVYTDLQYRSVRHEMHGPDEYGQTLAYDNVWDFLNPRVGFSLTFGPVFSIYSSVAYGRKEPNRSDIQASQAVRPERMFDIEFGNRLNVGIWKASANFYFMEYTDMLLETGRLNAVGYAIRENMPRAWRRGIELASELDLDIFRVEGNITLSTNKIARYTAYVDRFDANWNFIGQRQEIYQRTNMLLSPSVVGSLAWTQRLWHGASLKLSGKLVGSQYWDNTSCHQRRIPAYFVQDIGLRQEISWHGKWTLAADINNLFNNHYYAYAWVYRADIDGKPYQKEGVFTQAPINVMFRLGYEF